MPEPMSHFSDYLVFGSRGYLGSHVVKVLRNEGKKFATSDARIENREDIVKDIEYYKPKWVICAAGLTGKPNISWFETNQQEGIRINLIATLNVVDICYLKGIHCTLFGTGMLYTYDEEHKIGGKGFAEDETPNYSSLFYVKLRIMLEELISNYPNVLNLRIIYPISDDLHPKSLLSKLIQFKKIVSVPNSITVVDDLFPLIPFMCERGLTGNFNFSNPGSIDNNEILELYRTILNPNHIWETASPEEHEEHKKNRPNQELNVSKLAAISPFELKDAKTSLKLLMYRIKEK